MFTKNPYFFAFFPFALADAVLTILGQPQTYWRYGIVNEASPAYYVLQFSPYAYIAAVVVWLIIWYIIFSQTFPRNSPLPFTLLYRRARLGEHVMGLCPPSRCRVL